MKKRSTILTKATLNKQKSIGISSIMSKKGVAEVSKDMKDHPSLAQAKSFFRCRHMNNDKQPNQDLSYGQEQVDDTRKSDKKKNTEEKKPPPVAPQMGCVVCKAQIDHGENLVR